MDQDLTPNIGGDAIFVGKLFKSMPFSMEYIHVNVSHNHSHSWLQFSIFVNDKLVP